VESCKLRYFNSFEFFDHTGADWIKLMATGGISDPMSDFNVQELSEEQMRTAVEVAHRTHKLVMAHAEGQDGIKSALRAGVDSIEHGTLLDEEGAALMEKQGTWLVPTLSVMQRYATMGRESGLDAVALEKSRLILKHQSDAFQRAISTTSKSRSGWMMIRISYPMNSRRWWEVA
jgi:imidazolonepropionase-like amidohydrolase